MKKIKLLQSVSLFWDLTEKELGYITEKMVSKHYDAGQMILLEASEGEQCFFVTEGSVKITRLSKKGQEVILAILSGSLVILAKFCVSEVNPAIFSGT